MKRLIACVALVAAPAPATAQASAQSGRDVVVTARRAPPRAAARQFAERISRAVDGQLARVRWPICPAVLGIDPVRASAIRQRIRAVARAAGAPVAKDDCRDANSTVIISADPAALVSDIRKARPGWLIGVRATELDRLAAGTAPARAWQVTEVLNEDGRAMRGSAATSGATAPTTNPGGSGTVALPAAPVLQVMGSSLLQPSTQQAIGAAFLVLDAQATLGKSVDQVADYAAMRLLAATQPPAGADPDTILSLFAGDEAAPGGLTASDAAYLHALYHTPVTQRASARLDDMAGQMARARRAAD